MISFSARTLEKPQERQKPWRFLLQAAAILYVAWVAYSAFRDMDSGWLPLVVLAFILMGVIKQIRDFWKGVKPSPWAMIEIREESVTLFGRDSSFFQLPLPKGFMLHPSGKILILRWGRNVPRRCHSVTFRKNRDLAEIDFDALQAVLQKVAPKIKVPSPFATKET
ncbi:hypothetical protein KKG05_02255 [bacterium]|nr:hypothetical protein [bacterium]